MNVEKYMLTMETTWVMVPLNMAVYGPLNLSKPMARPFAPDLIKKWKVSLPATLAGTVEFLLFDRVHNKPMYGSRSALVEALLQQWVDEQKKLQDAADAANGAKPNA